MWGDRSILGGGKLLVRFWSRVHIEGDANHRLVLSFCSNVSEKLQGHQTNQRAELLVSHTTTVEYTMVLLIVYFVCV